MHPAGETKRNKYSFANALLSEWSRPQNDCNDAIPKTQDPKTQLTASVERHDEYHDTSQFKLSLGEYNNVIPDVQYEENTQLSTLMAFDS